MNLGGNTGSYSRPKKGGRKVPFLCNESEAGFHGGAVNETARAQIRKRPEPEKPDLKIKGSRSGRNAENVKGIPQGPSRPQTVKEENTI